MSWSKVKSYLRKVSADTKTTLSDTLACAFDLFSKDKITNWFNMIGVVFNLYAKSSCYRKGESNIIERTQYENKKNYSHNIIFVFVF